MENVVSSLMQMGRRAAKLADAGRHAEAVPIWKSMHRQKPEHAGIRLALGAALLADNQNAEAVKWLALSCQQHPDDAPLARLLGRALMQEHNRKAALGAFYHALSLDPANAETHGHIASALYWERNSKSALLHAEFACNDDFSDLNISTYVCILLDLGRTEAALKFIDRVIAARPENRATLLLYRAGALAALGRRAEALAAGREAALLAPENLVAQHHYAAGLLLEGMLTQEAWSHYEGRAGLFSIKTWPSPEFRWTTQDVRGRTVLIHAEQGLGDTLQFIRYVPMVAALGARVIVVVQKPLLRLLQHTPGADAVITTADVPNFDYYCPLLSLPGQFGTTLETIPPQLPYAKTFPPPPRAAKLQVGIVWAGGETFVEDRKRSLDPALLAPLAGVPDVEFHSLQFGANSMPLPKMRNAMEGVRDFVGTAERIARLDLVIAVDTSVAHLAATMGKPVWLLARYNGCWRWLLDREDSPWYPSVRLFRQPRADEWASVIERICAALASAAVEHTQAMSLAA